MANKVILCVACTACEVENCRSCSRSEPGRCDACFDEYSLTSPTECEGL